MKTAQGCPDGTWQEGWRQQDSEDFGTANDYSSNIERYLAGKVKAGKQKTKVQKVLRHAKRRQWTKYSYYLKVV